MICKVDFNVVGEDQSADTGWQGKLAHDARISEIGNSITLKVKEKMKALYHHKYNTSALREDQWWCR